LNARGVELTVTDLLKNYLFARVSTSENDLGVAQHQWSRLVDTVRLAGFPDFLRHHLNSVQKFVRKERLFQALRSLVVDREGVFALLDELEDAAVWYSALDRADDPLWSDYQACEGAIREHVAELILFRVTQYKSLVLAARKQFRTSADDLRRLLRACMVVSFRHTVVGQRTPSELERVYNDVAVRVSRGELRTSRAIVDALVPVYLPDDEFRRAFETWTVNPRGRRRLVAYVLGRLEQQLEGATADVERPSVTIEHILPEIPGPGWDHVAEEERERYTYRLGNLTLLERKRNQREAGNAPFGEKLKVYGRSVFKLTRSIAGDEWDVEAIQSRQREMARWATAIWRLDV
jgi:hypothetical protein